MVATARALSESVAVNVITCSPGDRVAMSSSPGLGLLTPAVVYTGRAENVRQKHQATLQQAYLAHPERFVRGLPQPTQLPEAVWINPPPVTTESAPPASPTSTGVLSTTSGPGRLASSTTLRYTDPCGPEDRATLRSDLSAVPADGVAGQGSCQANPAHTGAQKGATLSSKR